MYQLKAATFLICLGFQTACGSSQPVAVNVAPELAPYFQSFTDNTGASSAGISGQFADTTTLANPLGETVGECIINSDRSKLIQIDQTYWNTLDENGKTQLIYHELGHCALNRVHTMATLGDDCPASIMYPIVFGQTQCYLDHMQYYGWELVHSVN